jgi:hypothetical protein
MHAPRQQPQDLMGHISRKKKVNTKIMEPRENIRRQIFIKKINASFYHVRILLGYTDDGKIIRISYIFK